MIGDRARIWLTRNKIFFDTIAAFTLTAMAIILSYAQINIMQKQTEVLNAQLDIERQQAAPQFVVDSKLFMNEEGTLATDDKILVYNEGNVAYGIDVDTAVFLISITWITKDQPNLKKCLFLLRDITA